MKGFSKVLRKDMVKKEYIVRLFKKIKIKKELLFVLAIIAVGVILRFIYFRESVYFGYDEARDAFRSQEIYIQKDLKLLGPVANFPGLHHGPLSWYLIGPLYLIGGGNVFFVSAVFRIANILGAVLVYLIGKKFFNKRTGFISALIYAFSFEQGQYAIYIGNLPLAIFAWLGLFYGAALIYKDNNHKGLVLMFASVAAAAQLEIILSYMFVVLLVLLFLLRDKVLKIEKKMWIVSFLTMALILSTFVVAELKFNFQSTRAFLDLLKNGYDVMQAGDTRISLYLKMFLRLFHDNVIALPSLKYLAAVALAEILLLLYFVKKVPSLVFILVWIFSAATILPIGGYNAYYVNVGIGVGIIIGLGFLLDRLIKKNKALGLLILSAVLFSNLFLILKHNQDSLIVEIKAQSHMKLADELKVIDEMYSNAQGEGFTVRATTMPYGIQTVWAYLFNKYGEEGWGYLPYWEKELVEGYPGKLPRPKKGTTCVRYLIKEPTRGIPEGLINRDEEEENLFSKVEEEKIIGHFILQARKAHGECHNRKPTLN